MAKTTLAVANAVCQHLCLHLWLYLGFVLLAFAEFCLHPLNSHGNFSSLVVNIHSSIKLFTLWMTISCSQRHLNPVPSQVSYMVLVITVNHKGMPLSHLWGSWILAVCTHISVLSVMPNLLLESLSKLISAHNFAM